MYPPQLKRASRPGPGVLASGVYAPKGTPKDIVNKLNTEIKALNTPELKKKLETQFGMQVVGSTPAELAAITQKDVTQRGATRPRAQPQSKSMARDITITHVRVTSTACDGPLLNAAASTSPKLRSIVETETSDGRQAFPDLRRLFTSRSWSRPPHR